MSDLRAISGDQGLRARRWDVIVLGSGLAALVAAARLGIAGQKVLVVEEAGVRGAFPGLREPFFLAGARDGGMLEACLRSLKLPLIDRRRIHAERLSYQVVGPDLRFDVGEAPITAQDRELGKYIQRRLWVPFDIRISLYKLMKRIDLPRSRLRFRFVANGF